MSQGMISQAAENSIKGPKASGHGFSRAVRRPAEMLGFSPCGMLLKKFIHAP
jgi:hypothetical protein